MDSGDREKRVTSIGDVFRISVDDDRVTYGQVFGFIGEQPFVGLFTRLYPATRLVDPSDAVDDELAVAAVIMPSILTKGEWQTVGRCALARATFAPAFKLGIGTAEFPYEIVSFDGLPKRKATAKDTGPSGVPMSFASHVVKAMRVFHRLDQPFPDYERFLASNVRRAADAAGTTALKFQVTDLVTPKPRPREQFVTLRVPLDEQRFGSTDFRKYTRDLADRLHQALSDARAGAFASEGYGFGAFDLQLAGPNAAEMLRVLLPLLRKMNLPHGTSVVARYGEFDDPAAREERISLESPS
jgi:hypothetical protein